MTLTDDQIRDEWNRRPLLTAACYYALKRNARARAGLQGDDEFSRFCEDAARKVTEWVNARRAAAS